MSGEEEVDSFEDLDFEEDFEAVRLQVCIGKSGNKKN